VAGRKVTIARIERAGVLPGRRARAGDLPGREGVRGDEDVVEKIIAFR
jgi:hypothetical protein